MLNASIQQACMDTTDWLKGIVQEGSAMMDSPSSSSPSTDLISCPSHPPPTMLERRLRPPQDHALKCPRCDSTQTKFCYYNNYSLSQPRYFCKTCRRYWTKGGSLRNVPVGGGCRKNKRSGGGKKPSLPDHMALHQFHPLCASAFADPTGTDLQLSSFSGLLPPPMSHLGTSLPGAGHRDLGGFMECKHEVVGAFHSPNYHSDDKFGTGITGNIPIRTQLFSCITGGGGGGGGGTGGGFGNAGCYGDMSSTNITTFHGGMPPLGFSMDGSHGALVAPLPFDIPNNDAAGDGGLSEAKLSGKLLSLEWQEQGCSDVDRPAEAFGFTATTSGVGMWTSAHHGTSSTSNPLV